MFDFTIKPDGGEPFEVTATSRDVLVFERTSKGRTLKTLAEGHMTDLYKLAHIATVRTGKFTGDLKTFEETCDLDFEEDEEPDPTTPDRSAEL